LRGESAKLEQDIENAKQRKLQCEEEITKHEGKSSSFDADSTKHAKELEKMRKQEIEFNNKIRELQKKQQECEKETQKLKTDLDGMDSKLSHGMPHGTARAIRFLDDFCQQHKVIKSRARCRQGAYPRVQPARGHDVLPSGTREDGPGVGGTGCSKTLSAMMC
jgi:chromosome segregation ATPase